MNKTLYDISWKVTEPQYRADPALSYSTLSRFEKEGFSNLGKLFDKIETPSLTYGSAIDAIMTGGREEFDSRFVVADFPSISESLEQVAKTLYSKYGNTYKKLADIPDEVLAAVGKECNFYSNEKYANYRVRLIKESCPNYYSLLALVGDKVILNTETYEDVCATVQALRDGVLTSGYFADNQPDSPVQRYYQLKFRHSHDGVEYRNMADLIIVDYEDKKVYPFDLKTSYPPEWEFQEHFLVYNYLIQARLYYRGIRAAMDADDYFKDFSLENYKFIVVSRRTKTPLVWEFPYTKYYGELQDSNGKVYRDPYTIGKELYGYLYNRPRVPNGIDPCGVNQITVLHPLNTNTDNHVE